MTTLPNLFIVGAPRCGTSSFHAYLAAHSRIFMCTPKEPHYFGSDLEIHGRCESLDCYRALFADAGPVAYAGESSVLYLYSRNAPEQIREFCPEARIIIMLRDPCEMIASLHAQNLLLGFVDQGDLRDALALEAERREGSSLPPGCKSPLALQYTYLASYADPVRRYLETFGRQQVTCIFYDDLKAQPEQVYRETLAFLGLSVESLPNFSVHNERRHWRHPGLGRLLLKWAEQFPPPDATAPPFTRFTRALVPRLLSVPMQLALGGGPGRATSAGLEQTLRRRLAPSSLKLQSGLNRDLTRWLPPPQSP
jgi:hypothetical protein